MKNILKNKTVNIVFTVIEWIICVVLVILIALTGFQRFSNQGNFFGYRIYTVASGSMIPTYDIGDTLLINETSADNIDVGDADTYKGARAGVDGLIITHQVVGIERDEEGKILFHTKGIANNIEDPIVSEDQVLGKVIHKFFFLSILGRITTNKAALLVFITIPIAFLIAVEIVKIVYKKDDFDDNIIDTIDEKNVNIVLE
jgi:signal peptidase I